MKEPVVVQLVGLCTGAGVTAFDGQYLVDYDPSRDGVEPGTGNPMYAHLVTTPDIAQATRYTIDEVLAMWKRSDPRQPIRADGHPNRPLTAFTIHTQEAP